MLQTANNIQSDITFVKDGRNIVSSRDPFPTFCSVIFLINPRD